MNATDSVLALVRPDILALTPYRSARKESSGGRVWLDANENPKTPSAFLPSEALGKEGRGLLNRYPEPQPAALVTQLAALYGVAPANVLVTRGSDEGIDLLLRAFCRADRDAILLTPPTYGMYAVAAAIQGARVVTAPLTRFSEPVGGALCPDVAAESRRSAVAKAMADKKAAPTPDQETIRTDFALDPAAVLAALTPAVKLVFLCSPNNPTGQLLDRDAILAVVRALAGRAVVVVDEAYLEFADTPSLADSLATHPNLVVLRTLSKAHGLAGARVGATLAAPALIGVLQKIIAPYPVPTPVAQAALAALTPAGLAATRASVAALVSERRRLATALPSLPCVRRVWPGDANFLLVEVTDVARVMSAARAAGVILRDRSKDVPGAIRVTVGTPAENNLVLEVLARSPDGL